MDMINKNGVDETKEGLLASLKEELEYQMKSVYDEKDVVIIRTIVNKMEEVEPSKFSYNYKEQYQYFKEEYMPNAIKEYESFKKICGDNNFSKIERKHNFVLAKITKTSIATIILITVIMFSSALVMAKCGIFDPIVKWTDEVLIKYRINVESDSNEREERSHSTTDYFVNIEIEHSVVLLKPNYLPNGFMLSSVEKNETDINAIYNFIYSQDERVISFAITIWNSNNVPYQQNIEIISGYSMEKVYDDVTYYIFRNTNWFGATWCHHNIDYEAIGFETEEDVVEFIENLEL